MRHFEALMRHFKKCILCVFYSCSAAPFGLSPVHRLRCHKRLGWWPPAGQGRAHKRYAALGSSETFDRWNRVTHGPL